MGAYADRLIEAIREWGVRTGSRDYDLAYWPSLWLGWPYRNAGVDPTTASMTPVERQHVAVGRLEGHPTVEQLADRISVLTRKGLWEPFLVSAIAQGIQLQLDVLADADRIARDRAELVESMRQHAKDPAFREAWAGGVRAQQVQNDIPLDDHATPTSFDDFVARTESKLQPLTRDEIAERRRSAGTWREVASDLLDFDSLQREALQEGPRE